MGGDMDRKKILGFLILFICLPCLGKDHKLHIIGTRECGFFSNFLAVINHIAWCERTNTTPYVYWDSQSAYFQKEGFNGSKNAWEYYFEPVSTIKHYNGGTIDRVFIAPDHSCVICNGNNPLSEEKRLEANRIVKTYIKIKPYVAHIVDDFYEKHFKGHIIIGIHLRGTDKKQEIPPINPSILLKHAQNCADIFKGQPVKFFVASDEEQLINKARQQLKGTVITYDAERSTNGNPVHYNKAGSPAKRGLDILVEVLLLSRCSIFLYTRSNVSNGVLVFNPDLVHMILYKSGGQPISEIEIFMADNLIAP